MPEPTPSPLVTVVVVTWNGAHLLAPCLSALEEQTADRALYDVVVVDNASTDGTAELVRSRFPRVRLLVNDRNRGFAGGCNTALRALDTPYALLVNNDAVVAPDVVERMVAAVQAPGAERVAALTARLLLAPRFVPAEEMAEGAAEGLVQLPDGRRLRPLPAGQDDPAAVDLVNSTGNLVRTDGFAQDRGWLTVDGEREFEPEVFGFCGAAALLRMEAVSPLGGFDERWFLYYEDIDLSWRLRLHGWTAGYVADAVVRHAHGESTKEGSALHRFHDDRNRLLTVVKCGTRELVLRVLVRHLVSTVRLGAREAPDLRTTRVRLRALASFLLLLPHALRERRRLDRTAVVPRRAVQAGFPSPMPSGGYRTD